MKIVMLGAPGAGKGTQAEKIAAKYQIPTISTGNIFRKNMKEGTELGKQVQAIIEAGGLVPDELTNALVFDRLGNEDCKDGYILDGYPRTVPQAEAYLAFLAENNDKLDHAIDVDVPDESIVSRMSGRRVCPDCGETYHLVVNPPKTEGICNKCGAALIQRKDDAAETVQNRLTTYHDQTEPMISLYKERGMYNRVDGTQPIDKVFEDICAILG